MLEPRYKWRMIYEDGEVSTTASTLQEAVGVIQMVHDKSGMNLGKPLSVEFYNEPPEDYWGTCYVFPREQSHTTTGGKGNE